MNSHHNTTANEEVSGVQVTKGRNPSNTHDLQVAFVRDIHSRFREVRGVIRQTVGYENDALALAEDTTVPSIEPIDSLTANLDPTEVYDFPTDQDRVQAFMRDVRKWLRDGVLEPVSQVDLRNAEHWTAEYLQAAYVRGAKQAVGRLNQAGVSASVPDREELFNKRVGGSQLQQIYTRTFENLKDITNDAADTIRTELTRAIADGENPRTVADRLTNELQDITNTRATALARTEIMNSHATATLQEYEDAGVEGVQHVDRQTAADARVCPWCRALSDVTFTLSEFRNVAVRWGSQVMRVGVPAHPQGRCSPVPALGVSDIPPLEDRIPDNVAGKSVTIIRR